MLLEAVPLPSLAVGTVPEPKLAAFKAVRFTPLIAATVPVKLAAGKLLFSSSRVPVVSGKVSVLFVSESGETI